MRRSGEMMECVALGAITLAVFFFHLGGYGLWEPDEARYAEIAREMLSSGNFILPHLDYVIYIEKPPLLYWTTSAAFRIFGTNEFAARLVPALSALAGVAATYWFGRRVFDHRRAILGAAILTTCPLYTTMAQVLTTDMLLTALLSVAFFASFLQWTEGGRWWLAAYVASALAVLTKGPVGIVLPGLAVALFAWWQGEFRNGIAKLHPLAGLLLVIAIAMPWFAIMIARVPGFFNFYIVGEHFRRALVSTYSHGEPVYFYVPVILLGLAPWSICLPLLVSTGTRGAVRSFLAIAAGTVLVLFSAAEAKLIPYILPALPLLALLLADSVLCAIENQTARTVWRLRAGTIVGSIGPALGAGGIGCIVVAALASHFHNRDLTMLGSVIFATGAIILIGGLAVSAAFFRGHREAALRLVVITVTAALITGTYGRIKVDSLHSYAPLGRDLALKAPEAALIDYHRYPQAIPFYTHKRVLVAGPFLSELGFGAMHSPEFTRYFLYTDDALFDYWAKDPSAVLIIDEADLRRLAPKLGPVRVIARQRHKLAVGKLIPPRKPS